MPIDLGNFRIDQNPKRDSGSNPDLGPLANLPGTWIGSGFNAIWRPNVVKKDGDVDFFLVLNRTTETLEFTEVAGPAINRVLFGDYDIEIRAVSYLQRIVDSKILGIDGNPAGLHVEQGFWLRVPRTVYPNSGETVVRQALIPHGVSLLAQGLSTPIPPDNGLNLPTINLMPLAPNGDPGNGIFSLTLNLKSDERKETRTNIHEIVDSSDADGGITLDHLQKWVNNPNQVLVEGYEGKRLTNVTKLQVAFPVPSIPQLPEPPPMSQLLNYGGGISSISSLLGDGGGAAAHAGPNARPSEFEATFFIEQFEEESGPQWQLQYTQTVWLIFAGFFWPHISVANLRKQP